MQWPSRPVVQLLAHQRDDLFLPGLSDLLTNLGVFGGIGHRHGILGLLLWDGLVLDLLRNHKIRSGDVYKRQPIRFYSFTFRLRLAESLFCKCNTSSVIRKVVIMMITNTALAFVLECFISRNKYTCTFLKDVPAMFRTRT